jgi:hypothetical protein
LEGTEADMMLRRGRGKRRPIKRRMVVVIDHWADDAWLRHTDRD